MDYRNVKTDPSFIDELLEWSDGQRLVPIIVEGENVTIGHGGT